MPLGDRSDRGGIRPRTTSPRRESGLTSLGCSVTREPRPTDKGRQADMSAAEMLAGAVSGVSRSLAPDQYRAGGAQALHRVPRGALREA